MVCTSPPASVLPLFSDASETLIGTLQTIVATCNKFVHLNEEIFPEPHAFKPERWFGTSAESLEHWLVTFSKGPRSCLGVK